MNLFSNRDVFRSIQWDEGKEFGIFRKTARNRIDKFCPFLLSVSVSGRTSGVTPGSAALATMFLQGLLQQIFHL